MFGDPAGGRAGTVQCGSDSSRVRPILPGKPQCVDDAAELDEQPVAGGLDEAPAVLGDFRIEELAPQSFEAFEGAALIGADQPRIARHIGREDRRKPTGLAHSFQPALRRPSSM